MDRTFDSRIEAISAEALAERAAAAGRSVQEEAAAVREQARTLTIEEKLALSARLRAMTPEDCKSHDSTLTIRWFRDTHSGRLMAS